MFGWHHGLNVHEFEQTLGDGEGQGCLACCSPWGRKESDTTERLNNNNDNAGCTSESPGQKCKVKVDCGVKFLGQGSQQGEEVTEKEDRAPDS